MPMPGPVGLWSYLREYPRRYADQFTQGMRQFAETRNPAAAFGAINPTTPFIYDAALQAGGLIAPHTNRLNQAISQSGENLGLGPLSIPEVTDEQLAPLLMLGMGSPSKMGFYSPSGKALTTAPGKGTSKQYLAHLKKEPGATKEGKQTGLIQKLEEAPGTLTKEEVVSMWNPIELTETVRAGHRDHVIGGLSVGGVDFYRDGMPVDYDPYLLAKRAGLDEPTAAEHARAVLIEDVLIDEWKLREGWEERGEQGVVDAVRQKISERIESWEDQLEYDPDDDVLREQILELRDIQNRIPHLYTVQMDEASRHPLKYAESEGLNLPGGTNPKEILVQLPESGGVDFDSAQQDYKQYLSQLQEKYDLNPMQNPLNPTYRPYVSEGEFKELERLSQRRADVENREYKSTHWSEPNVLAHIRTNERDVGGKKALHIEEIQSDWHQEGQKKGYITETGEEVGLLGKSDYDRFYAGKGDMSDAEWKALSQRVKEWDERMYVAGTGVPDAPFKKNWHELAFKRALTEAVNDPSIERLTWTTGDVQADRYNLAKYIDSIEAQAVGDNFNLAVIHKDGHAQNLQNVTPDKLSDYVGKEMAEKIVSDVVAPNYGVVKTSQGYEITVDGVLEGGWYDSEKEAQHAISQYEAGEWDVVAAGKKGSGGKPATYSGLDLEVGGEFHKQLYDKKIPQFAKKFLKKYGVEPKKWQADAPEGNSSAVAEDGTVYYVGGTDAEGNWFIHKQMPDDAQGNWVDDVPMEKFGSVEAASKALREYGKLDDSPYDVWYIDITPEMRQDLQQKGVPLVMKPFMSPEKLSPFMAYA